MLDKSPLELNLVFVTTAANAESGDKRWQLKNLNSFAKLGFKEIDFIDFACIPQDIWLPRLQKADVVVFGGGNTFYLMHSIESSGLGGLLPDLLIDKVYQLA